MTYKKYTFLMFLLIFVISSCKNADKNKKEILPKPEPKTLYGIIIDSLDVYNGIIEKDQNLSDILLKYNVEYVKIDELVRTTKEVFDVRRINVGNHYSIICTKDTVVQHYVYEISAIDYVVWNFGDSIAAYRGEKPVRYEVKTAEGVIESSLWNTMIKNGDSPILALELSEIYAWTIDFFGIQKNDHYRIIYEERFVDTTSIGVGNIIASNFHHASADHNAYYFQPDSLFQGDYYDDEGASLRRSFLKAPLRYRRISSKFSHSRMHPILRYRRPHLGVDYAAPRGTPVHSVGDGVIISKKYSRGAGRMLKIKHNGTYTTAYLHLWKYADGIKQGVHVKQGQLIACVGSTGLSTGPHLDFRFYKNGKAVDPLKVKSPPVKPVDSLYMDDFMVLKDSLLQIIL